MAASHFSGPVESEKGFITDNGQIVSTSKTADPTGTTQTLDFDLTNAFQIDLEGATGNVTLTLSNPKAGASYVIQVTQGSVARNLVFPGSVIWKDGSGAPTITATNDAIDLITLYYNGTSFLGQFGQAYA